MLAAKKKSEIRAYRARGEGLKSSSDAQPCVYLRRACASHHHNHEKRGSPLQRCRGVGAASLCHPPFPSRRRISERASSAVFLDRTCLLPTALPPASSGAQCASPSPSGATPQRSDERCSSSEGTGRFSTVTRVVVKCHGSRRAREMFAGGRVCVRARGGGGRR